MMAGAVTSETYECRIGDSVRRYVVLRVSGVDVGAVPTVIDLHGSGSWPEEHVAVTGAGSLAAAGATVVVPQARIPFRLFPELPAGWAWNVPGSPLYGETVARDEPDDVAFIDALLTRLIEQDGVDAHRIHVRGFSGGARLASHLMAVLASRLASVCCVSGLRFVEGAAGPLPPLLATHGRLDALNPFEGDGGPRWHESVEAVAARWAAAAGCESAPRSRNLSDEVRETRYLDSAGFAAVRLITVADAAHSWPGTVDPTHIAQFGASGSFSASQAHWKFVREVDLVNGRTT